MDKDEEIAYLKSLIERAISAGDAEWVFGKTLLNEMLEAIKE